MQNHWETIYRINDEHKVYLVKNIQDGSLAVKKELSYYDLSVYDYLKKNHFVGIPKIIEYYEENKILIVIEEYIDGLSLEDILDRDGCLNVEKTKDIIIQLCLILKDLNRSKAVVHRDIKPSNIVLKHGRVFLIDFNTAKFVSDKKRDTVLLGTEGYAAPEQYGFGSSSIQSDIYAIGILMQELLKEEAEEAEIKDDEMKAIIDRCIKMDPKDRYGNYDELIGALKGQNLMVLLHKYAPVGFRGENLVFRVAIYCWYTLIAYCGLTMTMMGENGPVGIVQLRTFKVGITLGFLAITQFTFNYRNCQRLFQKHPFWLKVVMIVVIDYLILVLSVLIPAIIAALI